MLVTDLQEAGLLVPYGQMSAATTLETKYRLFDVLIALLGGALSTDAAELAAVRGVVETPGTIRPVYPAEVRTSLESAAFLNAFFQRHADWMDSYWHDSTLKGHPADNMAAVLALADDPDVSGARILELVYLAYQLWAAFYAAMPALESNNWDQTSLHGLIVPILASVRFGDNLEQMNESVRLSASSAMVLGQIRAGDITNWKCGVSGYAVARGLWCYRLSKAFSAPVSTFDGARGWDKVVAPVGELRGRPAGEPPVYANINVKVYPCFQIAQGAVACANALHPRLEGRDDRVRRISITLGERNERIANRPGRGGFPTTHARADHEVAYCVATVLLHGTLSPLHFEPRFLQSADIRRLWECTEIHRFAPGAPEDVAGEGEACIMEIVMDDGHVVRHTAIRPDGAFAGLSDEARLEQVKALVGRKRRVLEQAWGCDLQPVQDVVEHLEQHAGPRLLQAVHQVVASARSPAH